MKLFIFTLLLLLIVQIYAGSYFNSWESNSRDSSSNNVDRELNDLLSSATASHTHWQSSAASMPEAIWFKNKITQRLNNSYVLAGMTNIKNKIFQFADEKLEKCKDNYALDRSCLGRASGHIMQLIAAAENSRRRLVNMDY